MELTNINLYAEGYYSNQTHEENILIPKKVFDQLEGSILGIEIYIHDLDGKHSEVTGNISVEHFTEEECSQCEINSTCDGERLDERLQELFEDNGLDLHEEMKAAREFLKTIDKPITVEYTIMESQKEAVDKFVNDLEG